ncbi:MAG TPA: CHASE4 domain-containing protein [Kofleriaceae bacterium]|nr:CHASE4 domain-containing protein [Kofleriaceae bacterium]
MTLRQKTLLLVIAAVGALVAGLYASGRWIINGNFAAAERSDTVAKVEATRAIVASMADEFGERSTDWSDWDETSRFIADRDQAYLDANVDYGSFTSIGWDLFMIVRADGTQLVAVARDRQAGVLVPAPADLQRYLPALLRGAADDAPLIAGLALVDGRPMLLASRAIRNTDRSRPAVAGRLIIGQLIDDAWLRRLARFTLLDVAFTPLPALAGAAPRDRRAAELLAGSGRVHIAAASDRVIDGWALLPDLTGAPIVLLRVERDRAILAHGHAILRASTLALVIGGALVLALVLLLLGRGILRPLGRLGDAVRELERGELATVRVASKDELGELAGAFNQMAAAIADREASLRAARARIHLVLDATGDALVTCSLGGAIDGEVSTAARTWFGEPAAGDVAATYLAGPDQRAEWGLRLGLDQLGAGLLPFEVAVDQMPDRLDRDGRRYALSYRRIEDAGGHRLLIVASDITALAAAEEARARAREAHDVVAHVLHDPAAFERFVAETEATLAHAAAAPTVAERARALHTLKGNVAVYGMDSVAAAAHRVEDLVADHADAREAYAALVEAWRTALGHAAAHRRAGQAVVQLTTAEHDAFLRRLEHDTDRAALVRTARSWRLDPVLHLMERLADHARRIAGDRGKAVDVVVDTDGTRVDVAAGAAFWAGLVHVVRNAIDHGVDEPEARAAAGKPPRATIRLEAHQVGGALRVRVADDGPGIDWDRVLAAARSRGGAVAADRRADALFADGVSSRAVVDELSGRGVGLAAVRAACDELGVGVEVHSRAGAGTELVFTLGERARRAAA